MNTIITNNKQSELQVNEILSAGTYGVESAGLDTARKLGLRANGYRFINNFDNEQDERVLQNYPSIVRVKGKDPAEADLSNVINANATIILLPMSDHNICLRIEYSIIKHYCKEYKKAYLILRDIMNPEYKEYYINKIIKFINKVYKYYEYPLSIAIFGESESHYKNIYNVAREILYRSIEKSNENNKKTK